MRFGARSDQALDLPSCRAWFELRFYPLRDAEGAVERAVCAVHDVTPHARLKQELAESERFLRRIAEVSPVGIYRADAQGLPIYVNDRAFEIAGLAPGPPRLDWLESIDPRDRADYLEAVRRSVEGATRFVHELRMRRPDGSTVWVLFQGIPDLDAQGRLVGFVGAMTDVSEGTHAEEEIAGHRDRLGELVAERTAELERSHEELRRSERLAAVGSFAAGIGSPTSGLSPSSASRASCTPPGGSATSSTSCRNSRPAASASAGPPAPDQALLAWGSRSTGARLAS